jgi:hypothetical protein
MSKILSNNTHLFSKTNFLEIDPELRNQKDFVIQCLQRNGLLYEWLSTELKSDKDVILKAFTQNSDIYKFIPEKFKSDHSFLIELVNIDPLILDKFNDEFRNERNIILVAIDKIGVDALWNKNIEVYKDIQIMISAIKSRYGQNLWDSILNSSGDDAVFSKKVIDIAYSIYGDALLQHNFNWILAQKDVIERI